MKSSDITVTDQFCGAGGSSIGVTASGARVRLAMNHWPLAIDTHNTNFPEVDHDCTDISAVNPRRYPSTDMLITSPECTNHSLAKGQPRRYYTQDLFGNVLIDPAEERSRATMWDVPRFAEYHDYRIIVVENVVDAGKWRLFDSWLHAMHALGYDHEVVYFNSMFAWPTPQSRDRMYTVFWKRGNQKPNLEFRPAAWCQHCEKTVSAIQTWKRQKWGRYKSQYFYRCPECHREITPFYYAAFNAIDWTIKAERIGDRKRPLMPKTLERIQYGLDKYGRKPLIVTGRYTTGVECRVHPADQDPLPTQPGDASHAVVFPWLVETGYSHAPGNRSISTVSAGTTQTTHQTIGVVGFLSKQYGGGADPKNMGIGLDEPTGTITTWDHHAVVGIPPAFIAELHGTAKASGLDDPLLCVTAGGGHHALLSADAFLTYYYGQHQASGVVDPLNTLTSVDHVGLVGALEKVTIDDLTFRMLQPAEIGKAMAFPGSYVVLGTQREKVKQYGNAVTPPVMEMIMRRCVDTLL
ncbi:MAG: DNA cytosine methyltransferase [Planctomycetaceae bacterium]|nr:MAG: DNA cytosine methyltransferase [Planctomycetaceae bacterium]